MLAHSELQLLCDTYKKSRVSARLVSYDTNIDTFLGADTQNLNFPKITLAEHIGEISPHTVYNITDSLGLNYTFFMLEELEGENILFIGPYTHTSIGSRLVLELGEKLGVSPKHQKLLSYHLESVPIISEGSHLFVLLDCFLERTWESSTYSSVDMGREKKLSVSILNDSSEHNELDDMLMKMKALEKRYEFENEMLRAVTLGQMNKITQMTGEYSEINFEKRATDPLRNIRNYCIINNTLLRKAAEQGGVHPLYLDNISTDFAHRIEQTASSDECLDLMREMFRAYCRLVRKHSLKKYSPIIQRVMLFVDSDLSANLSLRSLAKTQNVTPSYLSTLFKKETGKTLTEYITEKRMKYASHLLQTTHLQVQAIALHCGIMDVQYFSKLFKKATGMTPKEYREIHKQ